MGLSAKGKLYTHLGRWGLYHRQDLGSIELPSATSSKGIGFWILVVLGILFVLVIVFMLASAAWTSSTATLAAPATASSARTVRGTSSDRTAPASASSSLAPV